MMEQRRIIALGVEGPPLPESSSSLVWQSYGQSRGTAFLGLHQRQENDAEQALSLACQVTAPNRRIVVKELSVSFSKGQPTLDWHEAFGKEMALMEAGETLVDPELAKVYDRLFLFEEIEEDGLELFFLRGPRRRPTRLRGLKPQHAPLVGRNDEMERLKELLEQIAVDQGQIAGIVGPAGIGKTRLLNSLKEELTKQSIPFAEGHFPLSHSNPYEGFRQVVVQIAGESIGTLTRWEMTDAESDYLRLFLNPGIEIPRLAPLNDEDIKQGLFFSVRKLIQQIGRNPFVVILDDLHWADPSSLELLEYLMEDLESHRLLFVLVHRDELEKKWDRRLNYNEIALPPFPTNEVEHFIKVILGADRVATKVRDKLDALSLGNPLFIEELVRQMIDREVLEIETDDEGKKLVRLKKEGDLSIPTTLHALIASRFDNLDSDPKEILRWAMLLGTRFEAQELETLLQSMGMQEIEKHIATLFDEGYLAEQSVFPKRITRFTHDLIFETVRESLNEKEIRKRNVQIGDFLAFHYRNQEREVIDRIAEHFLYGNNDIKAIHASLAAGRAMAQTHQFHRALYFHREAAKRWEELPMVSPQAHEILAPLIGLLLTVGELGETESALEQWKYRGVTKFPWTEGVFYQRLMEFELHRANYNEALEASERALESFGSDPRWENERYEMMHDRVNTLHNVGKRNQAIHEGYKTLRELNDQRAPLTRMRLWAILGTAIAVSGNVDVGLDCLEKAQNLLTPEVPVPLQIEIWMRTAFLYDHMGDHENSIKAYTRAIDMAREAGMKRKLTHSYTNRGIEAEEAGNYILALSDYHASIEEARQIQDTATEVRSHLGIADTLADMGATKECEAKWSETQPLVEREKDAYLHAVNQSVLSTIYELKGDIEKSIEHTKIAHEHYQAAGLTHGQNRVKLRLIRRHALLNKPDVAFLASEFKDLLSKISLHQWPTWRFQLKSAALLLASKGVEIQELDKAIDPKTCPVAWLRQELYVSKISWLLSAGETEQANQLRKEYREEMDRLAEKVPPEHRRAFHNHPLYKTP